MNHELEQAAREASEALGMSVEVMGHTYAMNALCERHADSYRVEVFDAIDSEAGEQPIEQTEAMSRHTALAYLSGLECGARIQREQYAELVQRAGVVSFYTDQNTEHRGPLFGEALRTLQEALIALRGTK